jgi:predicted nuclease with TOPRIM domain
MKVCDRKLIRQEKLNEAVLARIRQAICKPAVIRDIFNKIENEDPNKKLLSELRTRLKECRKKKDNLLKSVENGVFVLEDVKARVSELNKEIQRVSGEISSAEKSLDMAVRFEEVESIISQFHENFAGLGTDAQRELLSLIVEKIIVYPQNLYMYFRFPVLRKAGNKVRVNLR